MNQDKLNQDKLNQDKLDQDESSANPLFTAAESRAKDTGKGIVFFDTSKRVMRTWGGVILTPVNHPGYPDEGINIENGKEVSTSAIVSVLYESELQAFTKEYPEIATEGLAYIETQNTIYVPSWKETL